MGPLRQNKLTCEPPPSFRWLKNSCYQPAYVIYLFLKMWIGVDLSDNVQNKTKKESCNIPCCGRLRKEGSEL